ncbi:HNH endonuclease signature motif containing protein [Serinicoccus kebangsaanensis]|uniref:HNH endonuclease signature motif containing protein n=1 Tax=Serinicoccus kebangsaanensis TaxID=2602069 RepID=UPI00124F6260|nr:HNH endonuclease signature motif containing protein [Serinicoccus kebangsaanensis]
MEGSGGGQRGGVDVWADVEPTTTAEVDGLSAADYDALMGEVAEALGDLHGAELASRPARERVLDGLGAARRGLNAATLGGDEAATVLDGDLAGAIESVGELQTQLGAVGFTLAREAALRGLHQDVAMSLVDWLRVRCPWLSTQDAAQIGAIVTVSQSPTTAVIGEAVAEGGVPVHRAAQVARTMTRLASSLDPEQQEEYARIVTAAAARPDLSDRDLGRVCHRLLEDLLHETKPKERERTAIELRSISRRRVGPGLTRFTIDAPDGDAATINGVLTSALAAPAPGREARGDGGDDEGSGGGPVEPDTRLPGQRGYDALMTVIRRGTSNPGAPPSTARATVLLTIPFDPERGTPAGPASTMAGDYVPPGQAGELACSGELTPVWLTADGEPLALGRTARFASPAQWKALAVRDGGCSFPGCSALPQWSDSHHLDHWARGGHTDVDRMTLLCGRHHTHVHQRDLTATVSGGTVTWHV